ncbi:fungal specific transcription factor domain-containing protein [Colletotrichum plurivorum]|uniref:Fungal specific transcription factor domain-containing protein n=1 Tax=Colletotrichum plurivorum TaxID=2175906 RepID=A0A8H6J9B7_9PEZI|nr:fungal specific transcription factor domain-containing protein [Colletotrichum plurivorum]
MPRPKTAALPPLKPAPGAVARRRSSVCTREACESCRDKKVKCDGSSPCSRCISRNLECKYEMRTYQTKRSLQVELQELRDGQHRRDAIIAALAVPARADDVLRKLWGGKPIAEIYDTLASRDASSSPTISGAPSVTDDAAEPERVEPAWSISTESSSPRNILSPAYGSSEVPAPGHAQSLLEDPGMRTGACYGQAETRPLDNDPFRPSIDGAVAMNHLGQQGYDWDHFGSGPFASPALQSCDVSMMNCQEIAASYEYQQPLGQPYSTDDLGAMNWWACSEGGPESSSFSSTSSAKCLPWMNWQFPAPMDTETPGSHSIPFMTPSPHLSVSCRPPSRGPVGNSIASTPASSSSDGSSPANKPTSEPDFPAAANDHDENDADRPLGTTSPLPRGSSPLTRERQRKASARSWKRQKQQLSDLQAAKTEAETRNRELRRQHSEVLAEVLAVKDALMGHAGCDHPGISGWLHTQANNFVNDGAAKAAANRRVPGFVASAGGRDGAVCRS